MAVDHVTFWIVEKVEATTSQQTVTLREADWFVPDTGVASVPGNHEARFMEASRTATIDLLPAVALAPGRHVALTLAVLNVDESLRA